MTHPNEKAAYEPTPEAIAEACEQIKAARLAVLAASQNAPHGTPSQRKAVPRYRRSSVQ